MRYSVIIPVYNEQDCVPMVYVSVKSVMDRLSGLHEIIFVDDCSADQTLQKLKELQKHSSDLCVLSLTGHIGKSGALQAGFDTARGEICITLDGDGQDDPRAIPLLLDKMAEGYDVVCGWRRQRQDSFNKRAASSVANWIRRLLTQELIHDVGCTLRVFRKKDIRDICLSRGFHRFFTLIMKKKGYRIGEVEVLHHRRVKGVSKYGVWDRLGEAMIDLFLMLFIDLEILMSRKPKYQIKDIYRAQGALNDECASIYS